MTNKSETAIAKIQNEFCNWEITLIDAIEDLQAIGFTASEAEALVYSWGCDENGPTEIDEIAAQDIEDNQS